MIRSTSCAASTEVVPLETPSSASSADSESTVPRSPLSTTRIFRREFMPLSHYTRTAGTTQFLEEGFHGGARYTDDHAGGEVGPVPRNAPTGRIREIRQPAILDAARPRGGAAE